MGMGTFGNAALLEGRDGQPPEGILEQHARRNKCSPARLQGRRCDGCCHPAAGRMPVVQRGETLQYLKLRGSYGFENVPHHDISRMPLEIFI